MPTPHILFYVRVAVPLVIAVCGRGDAGSVEPWRRHTVDQSSKGADGVRLADFDGDGFQDIATGWEEGGVVRIYRNPGPARVGRVWPAATVGEVASAEDAVFVDLDGDGAPDVVSACEGRTKALYAHWSPGLGRWDDPDTWETGRFPNPQGGPQLWMFTLPMDVDGKGGIDLVTGSKGGGAAVGWWRSPEGDARALGKWTYFKLRDAAWVMSLRHYDINGDGNEDIVVSERNGKHRGVYWLGHPGLERVGEAGAWTPHQIWKGDDEVMFLDIGDIDNDGRADIAVALKPRRVVLLLATEDAAAWKPVVLEIPEVGFGSAKGVAIGDIDGDGLADIVGTCEGAAGVKSGVFWLRGKGGGLAKGEFECHDIGGEAGVKFDRVELLDLDGDGDLDVLTCEESEQLGVIWYENPTRGRGR